MGQEVGVSRPLPWIRFWTDTTLAEQVECVFQWDESFVRQLGRNIEDAAKEIANFKLLESLSSDLENITAMMGIVNEIPRSSITKQNLEFCHHLPGGHDGGSGDPPNDDALNALLNGTEVPDLDKDNITDHRLCHPAFERFKAKYAYLPERY